jgi:AbrB family looped-hinge helix DNA binding protein
MTFIECQNKRQIYDEGKMKTTVGIIKEVDKLGRIVIPKELRERFGLTEKVEIVATEFGIVVRNPQYELVRIDGCEEGQTAGWLHSTVEDITPYK